jgi:carbamoyl-phosphate synthase large subunit
MAGCEAVTEALKHDAGLTVVSLQELHAELH